MRVPDPLQRYKSFISTINGANCAARRQGELFTPRFIVGIHYLNLQFFEKIVVLNATVIVGDCMFGVGEPCSPYAVSLEWLCPGGGAVSQCGVPTSSVLKTERYFVWRVNMEQFTSLKVFALASIPLLATACGGGSGGPGGPDGPSYTSFDSLERPGTTTLKGIGREGTFTRTEGVVTHSDFTPVGETSADVTLDSDGNPTKFVLKTPSESRTWDRSNSTFDKRDDGLLIAQRNDGSSGIIAADPAANNFEYQTFGLWGTSRETNNQTNGRFGLYSVGSETAAADIPASGTATFKGTAAAQWIDAQGDDQDVMTADTTLRANFADRSVRFNTTNSDLGLREGLQPELDMNGTLHYPSGSNKMSGTVRTAGGMSGTADGRFYGPGAQEAGGVFSLRGRGNEVLDGGFGAVRQ